MKKHDIALLARILLTAIVATGAAAATMNVTISVNTGLGRHPISPYIYGSNQTLTGTENFTMRRQGGNRLTGYNWENNASNAGTDWNNSSDNYMTSALGIPDNQATVPGISVTSFLDSCLRWNAFPLITLQMAGYVARDKNGTVAASETAPSARWRRVVPKKPFAFAATPDTADTAVYMDEFINFLSQKYASSSTQWYGGCDLDNEPALWPSTHPRIHPDTPTCQELVDKSVALATAVKAVDSRHELFGPVSFGFSELDGFANANDWASVKGSSAWFADWYLDKMSQASSAAGKRLLDVFDFHWYSEATGNGIRIIDTTEASNRLVAQARMQAPRTLWDKNYVENSWIGQWYSAFLPLIPHLTQSIAAHYPGTKLSISEYNYGGENHVSGGIAFSDVLGIYGKFGVDYACYWQLYTVTNFTSAAFKMYRNYDGKNSTFGSTSVQASTSDSVRSSVYASVPDSGDGNLHLIVINKLYDTTINATIAVTGTLTYNSVRVWGFDSSSSALSEILPAPTVTNNSFSISMPRLSVYHAVMTSPAAVIRRSAVWSSPSAKVWIPAARKPVLRYELSGFPSEIVLYSLNGGQIQKYEGLTGSGTLDISNIPERAVVTVTKSVWGASRRLLIIEK